MTWTMYGHKKFGGKPPREFYADVQSVPQVTALYDGGMEVVYELTVRPVEPGEESSYWGWVTSEEPLQRVGVLQMVYPHRTLFEICFTYGIGEAEKAGHGRAVNLVVVPTGKTWRPLG